MNTPATAPAPPKATPEAIRQAIAVLFDPGDVAELRAFKGRRCTISGYYDDPDRLATDAAKVNRTAGTVYVTLNRIVSDLLARRANRYEEYAAITTSDDQILRRRWLPIDLDAERPAGISSTEAEHDAAIQRARDVRAFLMGELGWPEPVAADSGNGAHLLPRIDLPNDDESADLVQRCLEALHARFSDAAVHVDTGVFNASRIWKLYGTVAGKGDHTEARPHRLARLLHVPEPIVVVPVEKLMGLAALAPKPEPKHRDNGQAAHGSDGRLDVADYLARHGVAVLHDEPYRCSRGAGHKWVLERCVWNPDHSDKSAFVIQWDNGAIAAGCQHNSCKGRTWYDFRDTVEPGWRDRRQQGNGRPDPDPNEVPVGPGEVRQSEGEGTEASYSRTFKCYSMAQLAGMELSVDEIFRHALVVDTPGVFGGREKTLKSLIGLDCGISMATFTPWLGHFEPVRAARSVYFAGEGGLVVVRDYARRIARFKGFRLEDVVGFHVCDDVPNLDDHRDVRTATSVLVDHEAEFAFFDPLYLMLAGDSAASNVYAMGAILRRMLRACREAGCTPIVLHHFRKSQPIGQAPELSDLSQSGCAEFAGQWLLINRERAYDEERPGEHDLIVRLGSRIGFSSKWAVHVEEGSIDSPNGRHWLPTFTKPAEARREAESQREAEREAKANARLEADRKAIVDVMLKLGTQTHTAIRDATGFGGGRFGKAWASLVVDRTVHQEGEHKKANGQVYPIWGLCNE